MDYMKPKILLEKETELGKQSEIVILFLSGSEKAFTLLYFWGDTVFVK